MRCFGGFHGNHSLILQEERILPERLKIDVMAAGPAAGLPWLLFSVENSDRHPQDLYLLWNPVWRRKSLSLLPVKK